MTVMITDEERQQLLDRLIVGLPFFDDFAIGQMQAFSLNSELDDLRYVIEYDELLFSALNKLYGLNIADEVWLQFFKDNQKMQLREFMDELFWEGVELKAIEKAGYLGAKCKAAGLFLRLKEEMVSHDETGRMSRLRPSDEVDHDLILKPDVLLLLAFLKVQPSWVVDLFGGKWKNGVLGQSSQFYDQVWKLINALGFLLAVLLLLSVLLIGIKAMAWVSMACLAITILSVIVKLIFGRVIVGGNEEVVCWPTSAEIRTYGDLCKAMTADSTSDVITLRRSTY